MSENFGKCLACMVHIVYWVIFDNCVFQTYLKQVIILVLFLYNNNEFRKPIMRYMLKSLFWRQIHPTVSKPENTLFTRITITHQYLIASSISIHQSVRNKHEKLYHNYRNVHKMSASVRTISTLQAFFLAHLVHILKHRHTDTQTHTQRQRQTQT